MNKVSQLMVAAFAATITFAPAFAQQAGGERYGYHMGDWGWGPMIFGSIFMLLFWAAVIIGIVAVVRWLMGAGHASAGSHARDSAFDILRDRFARGEIDKEEFEERKKHLAAR